MLIIFSLLFKEEGGRRRQRQNKKEKERDWRHFWESILRKQSERRTTKKKAFCKKIFIRTMATGKGWIKQTLEFLLNGTPAALKRVIIITESCREARRGGANITMLSERNRTRNPCNYEISAMHIAEEEEKQPQIKRVW